MTGSNCLLAALARLWFALVLGLSLSFAATVCKLLMLCPCGQSQVFREGLAISVLRAALWFTLMCCPWIRIEKEDRTTEAWARLAEPDPEGRPVFLLSNHTSFLDTMIAVSVMPRTLAVRSRMYMSDHLYSLPLMGTCIRAAGHFPISYKSQTDGDFRVDRNEVAAVDMKVDEHVTSAGGILCFFPEGTLNKMPERLLPFRFGGMKRALKYDARIYHLTTVGCPEVWPRVAYIGGFPGTVRFGVEAVAPSGSVALCSDLRSASKGSGDLHSQAEQDQQDAELLAAHLQNTMQKHWDRLSDERGIYCCCPSEQTAVQGASEALLRPHSPGSPLAEPT